MPSIVSCPFCGLDFTIGLTMSNVTIVGARQNVSVPCPRCGSRFDALPGGDGTFSTVNGRLVRVARILAEADRSELANLKARVEKLEVDRDAEGALELAASLGWPVPNRPPLERANEALEFIIKLAAVLAILIGGGSWTVEQVQRLLER